MKHHFEQLRLDSVSRSFTNAEGQAVAALQGLDLTIQRGEFIALLGPSGCGKSTALNCIAGLQPLSGGGIWLDEKRIDVLPPEKRGFGMVFQNYALFPHMSVLDNVGFGLKMRGVAKSEAMRRAREALQLVQLVGHEHKLPGQLSGGQQQRVAIARAIVIEPPLILMDEPLSNLDTKLRIEMRAEIRRIHSQLERATLYVTHDQDEALSMADRIVVMKEGVVQQVATPKEVYTRPHNLHVARFMGYRNVAEFTLEGTQGEARRGERERRASDRHADGRFQQQARERRVASRGYGARRARCGERVRCAGDDGRIRRPRFAVAREDRVRRCVGAGRGRLSTKASASACACRRRARWSTTGRLP